MALTLALTNLNLLPLPTLGGHRAHPKGADLMDETPPLLSGIFPCWVPLCAQSVRGHCGKAADTEQITSDPFKEHRHPALCHHPKASWLEWGQKAEEQELVQSAHPVASQTLHGGVKCSYIISRTNPAASEICSASSSLGPRLLV